MNAEAMEDLQEKIVELCHAAGRIGLPEERIRRALETTAYLKRGDAGNADTVEKQTKYLQGKGFLDEAAKTLRPDLRRWITTAAGDEFLMQRGLI